MSPPNPSRCPNCDYKPSKFRRKCSMCGYAMPRHWSMDVLLMLAAALAIAIIMKVVFLR
jgi:hypothetical protein